MKTTHTINKSAHTTTHTHEEHGSVASYVVGFVLSIIFTIIPYFLVVEKIFTGSTLLAIVLGIGVLQMVIQLVFFLHLGRGPKPLYNVVFFFATAGVVVVTIGASLFIMDNLYRNMTPEEYILRQSQEENIAQIGGKETGACTELKNSQIVTVRADMVTPNIIEAQRCDTLTFVNETDAEHIFKFGTYPENTSYGGLFEILVETDGSEPVTLNEAGQFTLYDEVNPDKVIYLNVAE